MNEQLFNRNSQVILLQAQAGQHRRDRLQQWLQSAQDGGAKTWLLSCDREEGGPWAGLNDLFGFLLPQLQSHAPDLIYRHGYELAAVLPTLQRTISVRNPNLTDLSAPRREQARNYPADRAFRIVQGSIDLVDAWHERFGNDSPWVIGCDVYDRAGVLVRRFFTELMRRRGQKLNLTLLLATEPEASETIIGEFDRQYIGERIELDLPSDPPTHTSKAEMTRLAEALEAEVSDPIDLLIHLPKLIHYWSLSDRPEKAVTYQTKALITCTERGFYADALAYGEAALADLERYCPEDTPQRLDIYGKLYGCYASLRQPLEALHIVESAMARTNEPKHLFHCYFMMSMLYARLLPERDLAKAEAYLEKGREILALGEISELEKILYTSFVRNGLALVRHRQGRFDEAIKMCQSCYEELDARLKPDEQRLHRSVLLYNIAQVYSATGPYAEAIAYLTKAMAIDANYSEYYNDRGNLYMKLERWQEALNDYLQAIELSPPYWEVWANLGRCYRMLNRVEEAVRAYATAIDLDPHQFSVFLARAQAFEILEQADLALADYTAALDLNPQQPMVLANRAILHYDAGRYQAALADLEAAIALEPKNPDFYQNRAIALMALGMGDRAMLDLQTYLRLSPDADDRSEVESQLLSLQAGLSS